MSADPAGAQGHHVTVMVRVRPMQPRELTHDNAVEVVQDKEVVVFKPDAEFASTYDCVLGVQSTQDDIYLHVQDSVISAAAGYNATVFAYGQTGTGKTYTMMGPPGVDLAAAATTGPPVRGQASPIWEPLGVIPRALADLFKRMAKEEMRGVRVVLTASYCEIYQDRLYDLLKPYKKGMGGRDPADMQRRKALLEVREDKSGNTYIPSLLCVKVSDLQGVLTLLAKGARHRAVRHTEMNATSSRSHAILQVTVEQWPPAQGTGKGKQSLVIRSKINFVDLAGSERWDTKMVPQDGGQINEMTAINSSLSALATVVAALTSRRKHIPYRDSKLTHLLQDSLGGNCRTYVIATISGSQESFEETVSTLKFADRARAIGNNAVVNVSRDLGSVLALKEREITRLRELLASFMGGGGQNPMLATSSNAKEDGAAQNHMSSDSIHLTDETAQLLEELQTLRHALDLERNLRSELEAKMKQRGGSRLPSAGIASPSSPGIMRLVTSGSGSGHESPAQGNPMANSNAGGGSERDPFRAVKMRRAHLGLYSPAAGSELRGSGPAAGTTYRGSVTRHSFSAHSSLSTPPRSRASHVWAPGGVRTGPRSFNSSPTRTWSSGQSVEDALRRMQEQVVSNKAKAMSLAAASQSRSRGGSPMRRQARLVSSRPGGSNVTILAGILVSPTHRVSPGYPSAGLGPARSMSGPAALSGNSHNPFSKLCASAHASVQQATVAVDNNLPALIASEGQIQVSPDAPLAPSGGSRGWGRSALMAQGYG